MDLIASPTILKLGESNSVIKMGPFAAGTYYAHIQPNNNAMLSSLLVTSCPVGCSVTVNYFQTTSENENVERSDLISHNLLTSPSNQADQILVTKIHNKVFAELVVTGGTVVCGLYATAVSYSVGDFEGQFRYNMEQANLGADQGLPIMGVNRDENYEFLPIADNCLPIKLSGSAVDNFVEVSANKDLFVGDILNSSAVDTILNLTTTSVAVRVGANNLADRKHVILEGLSNNIKWGFSSSSQSFDLFKSQCILLPVGDMITIWARVTTGTGELSVGELS